MFRLITVACCSSLPSCPSPRPPRRGRSSPRQRLTGGESGRRTGGGARRGRAGGRRRPVRGAAVPASSASADAAIAQLYADGFEALDLREKVLIWHLSNAALAGRDIFYDQRYAHGLEMREVLEEILTHAEGVDSAKPLEAIHRLHEALLDQQRAVQQPDRPQVRPRGRAGGVPRGGPRRGRRRGAEFPARAGETLDAMLDPPRAGLLRPGRRPDPDQQVARPRPGPAARERQQPLRRGLDGRPRGLRRGVRTELAARQARRRPPRGGLPHRRRRPLRRRSPRGRPAPGSGHPVRHGADGGGAPGADHLVPHRTPAGPARLRHRLGGRPGLARRHHQRVHRGLHGRARRQGRLGSAGLLRQPGEDRGDPDAGGARAVVRGPHALGPALSQGRRCAASRPTPSTSSSRSATPGPVTPIGINLPNDQTVREQYGSKSILAVERHRGPTTSRARPAYRAEFTWDEAEDARAEQLGRSGGRP